MTDSTLSLQWGLESTATGAFTVARGLVVAATADNVSILALLACERFGSTLPISSMTLQKIAAVLIPKESATIAFIKATVGFLPNDSAAQLGKSAAGSRFLAFAAALIPTAGVFQSAVALDEMLRKSASDLTTIPTREGLRGLLKILEPRVPACGFFDAVVFCQKIVHEHIIPKLFSSDRPSDLQYNDIRRLQNLMLDGVPPAETVAELMSTFRQIGRLGSETVTGVTIRVGTAVPWVLAFSQWCLDVPISLTVGSFNLLGPSNSKVHIIVPDDIKQLEGRIKITIHHQLDDLSALVQPHSQHILTTPSASRTFANRMVSLPAYRDYILRQPEFSNIPTETILEALAFSIPLFLSHGTPDEIASGYNQSKPDYHSPRPYPEPHVIAHTAGKLLGIGTPLVLRNLSENQTISDVPLVSTYLDQKEKNKCFDCDKENRIPAISGQYFWTDDCHCRTQFFCSLTLLTITTFALSLFHNPESLFIQIASGIYPSGIHPTHSSFEKYEHVLQTAKHYGVHVQFENQLLMRWAKFLVGHEHKEPHGPKELLGSTDPIISYYHGQAIYPAIFETFQIKKYGYEELVCLPGVLRYKGETFDVVKTGQVELRTRDPNFNWQTHFHREDLLEQPDFQDTEISWRASTSDEGTLEATLLWYSKAQRIWVNADPNRLLNNISGILISETCTHIGGAPIKMAVDGDIFHAPVWGPDYFKTSFSELNVIRVGKAADQLCFTLAKVRSMQRVVVGRGACFACCLRLCRDLAATILLL